MRQLNELFCVDPSSPSGLRHLEALAKRVRVGDVAGNRRSNGYWIVSVSHKPYEATRYYAHHVIWELLYGTIPIGVEIDHIDRNPSNNHPSNLRLASSSQNNYNQGIRQDNKTGFKGVYLNSRGKYTAQLKVKGKLLTRGGFLTPLEANTWVCSMRETHLKEFNHAN